MPGASRTPDAGLIELEAQERYARERYQLYKAKAYGSRLTSEGRLRELERRSMLAKKRLDLARAAGNYQANTPSMRDGRTEKSPEPPVGHQARRTDRAAAGARKYFFEPNPNAKGQAMPKEITSDQVVAAAEGLGKAEFTRSDLAQKLGVEEPKEFSQGFRQARRAGRLDKVRDDEEGTGHFRLTDQ